MATAVIYASKLGNTKAAAEYIAGKIGADCINVKKASDLSKYDRIIIGSGVYAGKPAKAISKFVSENKEKLKNVSLFLTCMYDNEQGAEQLEKIAESLGIGDAIYFTKVKSQFGIEDSKLGEYIGSL